MIMTSLVKEDIAVSLVASAINYNGPIAIDTETDYNGRDRRDVRDGTGRALGLSLAYGDTALFLPFRYMDTNYDRGKFMPLIQKILDNKRIIFHNAKFDLVSLETLGLDTSSTHFYDTMLMAHLVDENNPIAGKGLDSLCKYYLKNEGKHFTPELKALSKKVGWDFIPARLICEYATMDAALTLQLFEFLKPRMDAENLWPVWEHKEKFTRLVMEMESRGVQIDATMAEEQAAIGEDRMYQIVDRLHGLNPASPKDLYNLLCVQLGLPEIINPKTGRRTFDKSAMEEYEVILDRVDNPLAKLILEYRGWQKTVSSNYKAYMELLSPDGRLRPSYKLHGTRTGRLSCEKPNLQQIPRESTKDWNGHLKKVFTPKDGSILVEIDYSQLELRLGTVYAQEEHLMEVFREGRDIFTEMAARIGLTRQETKTMVYSIQYGAGVNRIRNVFGITPIEARERINNYYNSYPKFKQVSNQVESIVRRHKKVPLWSGRFRHFNYPESEGYKGFNSVIQGGAADIVERVMLKVNDQHFPGTDILLTVHDSIVFEIEREYVKQVVPEIKEIMTDVDSIMGRETGVKFAVEAKKWGD